MSQSIYNTKDITLIGAGLTGSLMAILLARRGFHVTIYEKRPDMRKVKIAAGRSINLAISVRGLKALNEVGLQQTILEKAVPMRGRTMHDIKGQLSYQPYSPYSEEYLNSISRAELNIALMNTAEATGKVKIHFNADAMDYQHESQTLHVRHADGRSEALQPGVFFATDGSASQVRDGILKASSGSVMSKAPLTHSYKELVVLPAADGGFKMEKNSLHIWPRGSYMMIALPNFDGTFTCTLFLPNEGEPSFASLTSSDKLMSFFNNQFADAIPMIDHLQRDFFENPTGILATIKCWPWHYQDKALMFGDSSHGVVPFYGQGANCCFEDCLALDELIATKADLGWEVIFQEFSALRKPNSDAIADLAVENFIEMRDSVGQPDFLKEKTIERKLTELFPEYTSVYRMVSFSHQPYAKALFNRRHEQAMLKKIREENGDIAKLDKESLAPYLKEFFAKTAI